MYHGVFLNSNGLQPGSDGLQPNSDGVQRDGLQPIRFLDHPKSSQRSSGVSVALAAGWVTCSGLWRLSLSRFSMAEVPICHWKICPVMSRGHPATHMRLLLLTEKDREMRMVEADQFFFIFRELPHFVQPVVFWCRNTSSWETSPANSRFFFYFFSVGPFGTSSRFWWPCFLSELSRSMVHAGFF